MQYNLSTMSAQNYKAKMISFAIVTIKSTTEKK